MNNPYSEKECAIFDAVLRLADRGVNLSTVKMQEIAAEASMGKSTLYEYFVSKEELLHSTMIYCLRKEITYLSPHIPQCKDFHSLLTVLMDYAAQLVFERMASYSMFGHVFSGRRASEECPFVPEMQNAFAKLLSFAHELAKKDGLSSDEDTEYFEHVITSCMISHAVNLLRMKNLKQLGEGQLDALNDATRRMIVGALKA